MPDGTAGGRWTGTFRRTRPASPAALCTCSHVGLLFMLGACAARPPDGMLTALRPGLELSRAGDEIVACGRLFHTGTRVVLWSDPGGYDAYRAARRFSPRQETLPANPVEGANTPMRYSPMRGGISADIAAKVERNGWTLPDLQRAIDLFVIHYDVAGTSRRCFEVLQDQRGLSVHFMLDIDGTIYQTLDLKERARHAGSANDRSIGIEIAQMGAYPDASMLSQWYERDGQNVRLITPPGWQSWRGRIGGATASDAYSPARMELIRGEIHGNLLFQYDFTPEQYRALSRLAATLSWVFPRIRLDAPRDVDGSIASTVLSPATLQAYSGLIGHYHLTTNKTDPGPAFNWDQVLNDAAEAVRSR